MTKAGLIFIACTSLISACGNGGSAAYRNSSSNSSNTSVGSYEDTSPGSSRPNSVAARQNHLISSTTASNKGGGGGGQQESVPTGSLPGPQEVDSLEQSEQNQRSKLAADHKIIRNAELDLETDSPESAQQNITSIAESKGGFVVESQQSSSDVKSSTRDIVTMTVRVPAERFGETLDEIRKASQRVVTETVKGQDVTEEFIDIEAQLKAKKALETQFMEIMKRANTVEDALNVQSQLADVRGEIERIEGRKRFLENQSSLSTIKIRLQTPRVFAAASEGFSDRLADSFASGFDVALNFVLALVTFVIALLPAALLFGLPGFLLFRYFWRRSSRPVSLAEIAEEEIRND